MEDIERFLEFKKFYLRGLDYARDQVRLEEILLDEQDRLELGDDPEDDLIFKFHDLEPENQSALLFGYASGLEDVLREISRIKPNIVRKATAKVFHTEEREDE